MTPEELAQMKKWVDNWKQLGPELERIREEEVRAADTWAAFQAFDGLATLEPQKNPPEPYSGLVEQQRWFKLAYERSHGKKAS
jgi:hypothetical protein